MEHWSFMMTKEMSPGDREVVQGKSDARKQAVDCLSWLLALLRAQYWSYQNSHWTVTGDSFYGSHLLFQRIYDGDEENEGEDDEGISGEIDALAEKIVGTYGPEALHSKSLLAMVGKWTCRWEQVDCLHKRGLLSEQDFKKVCRWVYEKLESLGELTMGMDDFLMALDSEHETNEYLLRQALRSKEFAKAAESDWASMNEE